MELVEVRCCCNAAQLLGWIEYENPKRGDVLSVNITQEIGEVKYSKIVSPNVVNYKLLQLMIERFIDPVLGENIAFKADGIGVDTLRKIREFKENI